MSTHSEQKPKRRGRPPGSKNKKKKAATSNGRGQPKKIATSLEATIKQLLSLPANAETKIRLIQAALDA